MYLNSNVGKFFQETNGVYISQKFSLKSPRLLDIKIIRRML